VDSKGNLPLRMDMTSGVNSPVPKQGKYQCTDKLIFKVFVVGWIVVAAYERECNLAKGGGEEGYEVAFIPFGSHTPELSQTPFNLAKVV
jgi:hypothetical protein